MIRPRGIAAALLVCGLLGAMPASAGADEGDSTRVQPGLEHLVPGLRGDPWQLSPGPRAFEHRLVFSPGFGVLGNERLYLFRVAYNPNPWLGYEAALGHNPGEAVHALFHGFSALVRYPFAGRVQPYLAAGYGMMLVFPGRLFNADPVTKNALSAGGGLELYLRDDVALRGELRHVTVLGRERDREGTVAYDYREATLGFSFYRTLGR